MAISFFKIESKLKLQNLPDEFLFLEVNLLKFVFRGDYSDVKKCWIEAIDFLEP